MIQPEMTRREYFTALAFQAFLSDSENLGYDPKLPGDAFSQLAEKAIRYGDALEKVISESEPNQEQHSTERF